jgi:SH3-like domain-containing protein
MRAARLAGGTALLLIGALTAHAEPVPYEATIAVPEVEARSGPSNVYYPTSKLRQGDRVTVVKEEPGWLAIKPSAESFSWINSHLLQPSSDYRTGVVLANDAEVRIGSALTGQEPTVCQVKLARGTQVFIRDFNKAYTEKGGWLAIYPPALEVRYIPADALKAAPQVQTAQASPVTANPAVPSPPASANPAENDLWHRAEQAESRNPDEAKLLYKQLAHQTTDHDLQMRCYNRIHFLREGTRGSVPAGYQPGQPSEASYPNPAATRFAPMPSMQPPVSYPPPRYGQPTSQYTYYRETSMPRANPSPTSNYANYAAPPPAPAASQWSPPGWLRRTSIFLDGSRPFALVAGDGKVLMYMTPQPGLNLDEYVEKHVMVLGPLSYHNQMRTYFMHVQQVKLLP